MELILAALVSASLVSHTSPSVSPSAVGSVASPTVPYTPADSGVNQNRPPINTPQTSPSPNPSETWEQKMLRRYERKVA
jgi:hypothetical protein